MQCDLIDKCPCFRLAVQHYTEISPNKFAVSYGPWKRTGACEI
jgi:hypothetical protein